jgi:hypothetical protein
VAPLIVEVREIDSEEVMKTKLNLVMLMALAVSFFSAAATAQNTRPLQASSNARLEYAIYDPSQSSGLLRLADWDDHHRCDGDHDRDDRNCYQYWRNRDRDRDGDRYRDRNYYRGNGFYGGTPVYVQHGWYDRKGKWHWDKNYRHGDDR